jgi:hypothetical protein
MRTESKLPETVRPTQLERVTFTDGMIVTADDLDAAMLYPASMLQIVLRAFLGCGIVCGLEIVPDPDAGGDRTFVVCIRKGVAIDCNGYPLELCKGVKLDLTPDPCADEPPPEKMCIVIRRSTSNETVRHPCGCDPDDSRHQCTRSRDHILIKAVREEDLQSLKGTVCAKDEESGEGDSGYDCEPSSEAPSPMQSLCDCLKKCSDCGCSDDTWVLLGCVALDKGGVVRDADGGIEVRRRKYVKPIECHCRPTAEQSAGETPATGKPGFQVAQLEERLQRLEVAFAQAQELPDR